MWPTAVQLSLTAALTVLLVAIAERERERCVFVFAIAVAQNHKTRHSANVAATHPERNKISLTS